LYRASHSSLVAVAAPALSSLCSAYANASRMEESNSWRNPVDLIEILDRAFERIPESLGTDVLPSPVLGMPARTGGVGGEGILHGDDPQAIADSLLAALRDGIAPESLATTVTYAAALRIARFHTSNEFADWDRALHTFTFANAVSQGLKRIRSRELVRGIFDAAMSVYLDRFLNIPPARIPEPDGRGIDPVSLLDELPGLFDKQQQVNEAGALVARFLYSGGDPAKVMAALGRALLREDRDFHTIQTVETAFRLFTALNGGPEAIHALIAAARYLAAHAPTVRAQGQTYQIAERLHRGERLFED